MLFPWSLSSKRLAVVFVLILLAGLILYPVMAKGQSAQEHLIAAQQFMARGLYLRAQEEYLAAAERNPSYKEAYFGLGELYTVVGRYAEAQAMYDKALALDRFYVEAWNARGRVFLCRDNFDSAALSFESALASAPTDQEATYGLGVARYESGDVSGAAESFRRLLRFNPNSARALVALGVIASVEGRAEEASEFFLQALQKDPASYEANYYLGRLYADEGRLLSAIERLEAAIAADPLRPQALREMERLRRQRGEWDLALSAADQLQQRDPDRVYVQFTRGVDLERMGSYDAAVEAYLSAMDEDPLDGVALYRLEEVLVNHTSPVLPLRLRIARRHLDQGREAWRVFDRVGTFRNFRRAVRVAPQMSEARLELAKFYNSLGFYSEALSQLDRVFELTRSQSERQAAEDLREQVVMKMVTQIEDVTKVKLSDLLDRPTAEAAESLMNPDLIAERLPWTLGPFPQPSTRIVLFDSVLSERERHAEVERTVVQMLRETLGYLPGYDVIERGEIASALSQLGLSRVASRSEGERAAEILGADYLVLTHLEELRDRAELRMTVVRRRDSAVVLETSVYGEGALSLEKVVDNAARVLSASLQVRGEVIWQEQDYFYLNLGTIHGLHAGDTVVLSRDQRGVSPYRLAPESSSEIAISEGFVESASERFSRIRLAARSLQDVIRLGDRAQKKRII